jgi:hypothetical protein
MSGIKGVSAWNKTSKIDFFVFKNIEPQKPLSATLIRWAVSTKARRDKAKSNF